LSEYIFGLTGVNSEWLVGASAVHEAVQSGSLVGQVDLCVCKDRSEGDLANDGVFGLYCRHGSKYAVVADDVGVGGFDSVHDSGVSAVND
jgi:hypothetical protein